MKTVVKANMSLKKLTSSREISLLIVLVLLCVLVELRGGNLLSAKNLSDMLKNYSTTMTLSLGMMCVLLIGGIDISVSSTLAFSGMCAALLMRAGVYSSPLVFFVVSIAIGTACGALVGLVITKGKILPIIATLGFQYVFLGMTYIVSNSAWVSSYQFASSFKKFALQSDLSFGLMNNMVTITLVCYIVFFILMRWSRFGRKIYAVGSNPAAAGISGININKINFLVYMICGGFAGLAGAMHTSMYASAQSNMGSGMEMDVIACCVLGGVSLNGGQGSVVGVFIGAAMFAVISKFLPLIGVSQFWQSAIKGAIILIAIVVNVLAQRAMHRGELKRREI